MSEGLKKLVSDSIKKYNDSLKEWVTHKSSVSLTNESYEQSELINN